MPAAARAMAAVTIVVISPRELPLCSLYNHSLYHIVVSYLYSIVYLYKLRWLHSVAISFALAGKTASACVYVCV